MKISSCQNVLEHKCRLFCIPFLFNVPFADYFRFTYVINEHRTRLQSKSDLLTLRTLIISNRPGYWQNHENDNERY